MPWFLCLAQGDIGPRAANLRMTNGNVNVPERQVSRKYGPPRADGNRRVSDRAALILTPLRPIGEFKKLTSARGRGTHGAAGRTGPRDALAIEQRSQTIPGRFADI
ncbi:unnamed protein product [Gadus morhua 'NCC']